MPDDGVVAGGVARIVAQDPVLGTLWDYWRAKRGGRPMPARQDIDPTEIPKILSHLQFVDRVDGRFRYRLTGTAIVEAYGAELTGRFVDEVLPPPRAELARRHYETVFATGRPIFARNKYVTTRAADFVAMRIVLPLSDGGDHVAILLLGQSFEHESLFAERAGMDAAQVAGVDDMEFLDPDAGPEEAR